MLAISARLTFWVKGISNGQLDQGKLFPFDSAKRFDGDHIFTKLGLPSAAIFLNSVSAKRFAVGVENEKRRITEF